ncbi:hypothetical protein L3X38_012224 [Prunus dulcis]|uniref:Integrase catalytic domain-containing protein n=1 Tax=Prunus dulcis TaxID=3755 RepID=A0AAD4ZF12_PRUDU|nr:hypothetical protein L3X38_012224 [Prunus dulcis]
MSNMAGSSTTELRTPVFNRENYEFWSIRMKTILKSHGLWDLVEHGFNASDPKNEKEIEETKVAEKSTMAELLMKDARALGLIQSVVSDQLFPRIVNEETSKGAWNILKLEFRGDKHVRNVKLQGLRREFEYTRMKDSESLSVYLARLFDILNHMKSYDWIDTMRILHKGPLLESLNAKAVGNLDICSESVMEIKIGCSNHMTGDESLLVNIQRNLTSKVKMGTGEIVPVAGKGTLVIKTKLGKKHIQEVMLVPGLEENLLSVGQMMEHGCFPLTMMPANDLALKASVTHCLQTWHKRLGHLNERSIKLLEDHGMVHGLPHLEQISVVCEGCMLGKQHRDSFPLESTWRATSPLELVHTDICGPMKTESISGNRYCLLFTDDCTRMSWVYFIRNKSSALECFKKFKAMTELQSGYKIKGLRSDRGGEFLSSEFNKFCDEFGIQRQLTIAYSPQQNGVVERKNRTVVEMAKSMLHEKALRHKLEENSHKCIFVGYGLYEKGYRLFDPSTRKVILSRDVQFDENGSWKWENASAGEMTFPVPTENQNCNPSQILDTQMQMDEGITQQNEPSQSLDTPIQIDEGFTLQDEGISESSQAIDHTPKK